MSEKLPPGWDVYKGGKQQEPKVIQAIDIATNVVKAWLTPAEARRLQKQQMKKFPNDRRTWFIPKEK